HVGYPSELTGQSIECPHCHQTITLPSPFTSSPPSPIVYSAPPPVSAGVEKASRNRSRLFPRTLSRNQYLIRCLIVFVVVAAAFLFFVAAPTDVVRIAAILFESTILLALLYNIFGLSIPRLKNAELSFFWLILVF